MSEPQEATPLSAPLPSEAPASPPPGGAPRDSNESPSGQTEGVFQDNSKRYNLSSGNIDGEQVTIANEINYYLVSDEGRVRKLSIREHFERLEGENLRRVRSRVFFEQEVVEPILQRLEERPLLVLAGEAGIGKTSLAMAASSLLHTRGRPRVEEVLVCRRLEGGVRVDFRELTGEGKDFRKRGIILSHALTPNNVDSFRFFSKLTEEQLDSCLSGLRRSGSFLIVTMDQSAVSGSMERLRGLGILHEFATPPEESLREGFRDLARRWAEHQENREDLLRKIEEIFQSEGSLVCAELRGMTGIATLVREYLPQVLAGHLTFAEAVRRVRDLSGWLLEDLTEDPEVWCSVLSLVLCSASQGPGGVPWVRFDALRRELSRFVSHEMGRRRPRRTLPQICHGNQVLKRARALVDPRDFPGADVVRFESAQMEDRLWEVLLGPGRDIAGAVVPFLRKLVRGSDLALGQAAASALGRIGQLDPIYITYPLVEKWTEEKGSGALSRGALLGHLYRGILGTREDHFYREGFLQRLRTRLRSDSVETVRTILLALLPVATYDEQQFELAMGSLREVAEKWLRPEWKDLREIADLMRDKELAAALFKKIRGWSGTAQEIQELGRTIAHGEMFKDGVGPVFWAFQHTLTGLFFSVLTQRAVLDRLLAWSREDEESVGPLISYLFLRPGGIGDALGRMAPARQADGQEKAEGSPFVELLHADPEATESLVRLLEQVHRNVRAFPGLLHGQLEESLIRLLGSWAREGRSIFRLRPTVLDILSGLFESVDEEVSERILRLAQEPPSTPELMDLHQLAIEAVTRPARRRIS